MLRDLNLDALRRIPRISYYFRYPLHYSDFHELREQGRLRGHYTAKPLHGRLTTSTRTPTPTSSPTARTSATRPRSAPAPGAPAG